MGPQTHYMIQTNQGQEFFIGKCKHCGAEGGRGLFNTECPGKPIIPENDLLKAPEDGK